MNRKIQFTQMIYGQNKFTPSMLFLFGTMINFFMNIRKFNVPDYYTFAIMIVLAIIASFIASM